MAIKSAFKEVIADPSVLGALERLDPTISELRADLAALERSIRILDTSWTPLEKPVRGLKTPSLFPHRTLRPKIMEILRESDKVWDHKTMANELIKRHNLGKLRCTARDNLVGNIKAHFQRDFVRGVVEQVNEPAGGWRLIRKPERAAPKPTPASNAVSAV